jgi:hypothetical protein
MVYLSISIVNNKLYHIALQYITLHYIAPQRRKALFASTMDADVYMEINKESLSISPSSSIINVTIGLPTTATPGPVVNAYDI